MSGSWLVTDWSAITGRYQHRPQWEEFENRDGDSVSLDWTQVESVVGTKVHMRSGVVHDLAVFTGEGDRIKLTGDFTAQDAVWKAQAARNLRQIVMIEADRRQREAFAKVERERREGVS